MKNKKELIMELRSLTSAGMSDCAKALEESSFDLQKAVDLVKIRGLAIADGRTGRVAAEGLVIITSVKSNLATMVEVNCQTDFVANSADFKLFAAYVGTILHDKSICNLPFMVDEVESTRAKVVSTTKENVVIRRWWVEESLDSTTKVFFYSHSNRKIGVLLTMKASTEEVAQHSDFKQLGEDLAMQVCAMNPLAVSPDRLGVEDLSRQKMIFETQLKEEGKPEKMWSKIMEGKLRKWNTEVCLLEQESVVVPKTTVKQVIKNLENKLGAEIQVINFNRCLVGEGLDSKKENLAEEVAKMM